MINWFFILITGWNAQQAELKTLRAEVEYLKRINQKPKINEVLVTSYNPVKGQTDSTPDITASNDSVCGWTLALSRDMLQRYTPTAPYKFGDTVYVTFPMVIKDTMNKRFSGRADMLSFSRDVSVWLGKRKAWISQ